MELDLKKYKNIKKCKLKIESSAIEIMRKSYDRKEEELQKSINDNADLFVENRKLKRIVYAYEQEHKIVKEQNEEMANSIKEMLEHGKV